MPELKRRADLARAMERELESVWKSKSLGRDIKRYKDANPRYTEDANGRPQPRKYSYDEQRVRVLCKKPEPPAKPTASPQHVRLR